MFKQLCYTTVFASFVFLAHMQCAGAEDFSAKCASPGVLHCSPFDTADELFYTWPSPSPCDQKFSDHTRYSISNGREGPGNTAAITQDGECIAPEVVTDVKHSGAGALRFTIPSNSSANSSGWYSEPFQRNNDGTFGYVAPGSPLGNIVYVQWYQYFDSNFLNTDFLCTNGGCGGWKQAIWYGNPPNGASSSGVEVTNNNGWERGVPHVYGQQGLDDYGIQDVRGCTYMGSGFESRDQYTEPPCIRFHADRWMEFTMRIEVRGAPNSPESRVQLWVDGELAVDYQNAKINWGASDGDGLGQFQLTPYHTNKDPSQSHPIGYTWYDDVIVSTQPIAMSHGPMPPRDLAAE